MKAALYLSTCLFLFSLSAGGAVRYVDEAAGSDANNGTSWALSWKSLTNALAQAAASNDIWVTAGTYKPGTLSSHSFAITKDIHLYGGFTNGGTLGTRNWTANKTILDGNLTTTNSLHVIKTSGSTTKVTLDGFTVRNGLAAADTGGAIDCDAGTMTIRNCLFTNNIATINGGAVYLTEAGVQHTFSNCTFAANRVTSSTGNGGAVCQNTGKDIQFRACTFLTNTSGQYGGAVYIAGAGVPSPWFINCHFSNNVSDDDAAAIYVAASSGTNGLFSNCTFTANSATNATGNGGAVNINLITPIFADCVFSNNSAGNDGGAAHFPKNGTYVTLRNCVFVRNRCAGMGGAIWTGTSVASGSMLRLYNSTFYTNTAVNSGGAINAKAGAGNTNLVVDCTFRNNVSGKDGGAIRVTNSDIQCFRSDFISNSAADDGGVVAFIEVGNQLFLNCLFAKNQSCLSGLGYGGGALQISGGSVVRVENCTFYTNNSVLKKGGAIQLQNGTCSVTNSIFRDDVSGDLGPEMAVASGRTLNLAYCDIDLSKINNLGITNIGPGVINVDPLFVDPVNNDFHLKSKHGRWTVGGWVNDAVSSPCIDTGNPANAFAEEPGPDGGRINMGRYGNTSYASKSEGAGLVFSVL